MFPAMTLMISTMRSPLQALTSLADGQVVAIICKERVLLGAPNEEQLLWVIDLIVVSRGEEIKV